VGIGPAIARRNRWLRQPFAPRRANVAHDDPWARDARLARLEAIMFLAREPLSTRRLAQLAGLADGTEARTLIRRLNRLYDGGGSPLRAEELAGGFQLLSRAGFGAWLRRLNPAPVESRLSGPALETLAIVAYRQPVLKAEIDSLRGVDCGEIVRQLMDRDLVRMIGRARDLGRPYLYGTTKRFLRVFGLRGLDDLPRAAELRGRASDSNNVPTA
jgi:segregation and condensation protein B